MDNPFLEDSIVPVRGKFGDEFSTLYFDLFRLLTVFLNSPLH